MVSLSVTPTTWPWRGSEWARRGVAREASRRAMVGALKGLRIVLVRVGKPT